MIEKFSPEKSKAEKTVINNPRDLFKAFTGLRKHAIEDMGYVITETKQNIEMEKSWSGSLVEKKYEWIVRLTKDHKEIVLNGLVDHRFNSGGEPSEITVEKNDFSEEELENFLKIEISF